MVPSVGVEPTASELQKRRSIQLSYDGMNVLRLGAARWISLPQCPSNLGGLRRHSTRTVPQPNTNVNNFRRPSCSPPSLSP